MLSSPPRGPNQVTNPQLKRFSSVPVPVHPVSRPFTLPAKDVTAQDPFSRNLTPTRIVPAASGSNSAAPSPSPGCVSSVPAAVPSPPISRPVFGPSQLQSVPVAASSPFPPATPARLANAHPLLGKAPSFWAPPRENSALTVVAPIKKSRVRTRARSRRMNRHPEEVVDEEGDEDEG